VGDYPLAGFCRDPLYWEAIMWSERKQGFSTEQVPVSSYGGSFKNLKDLTTEGPSWGYPRSVLGAIDPYLEPFCGHLSRKDDEIFQKWLLIEGSKGLAWRRTGRSTSASAGGRAGNAYIHIYIYIYIYICIYIYIHIYIYMYVYI